IPAAIIGAAQNGGEAVRVLAQNNVEVAAAIGREHLAPITFAHGRDLVAEHDPAFKQIEPPEIFDAVRLEITLRQIRQVEIESPETSLLGQMMDGEDGRERQLLVGHEDGNKRGGPIVGVKNLGRGWHPPRELYRGLAKANETP